MDAFGPIQPAPVFDTFSFDYALKIGLGDPATITSVYWTCVVDPSSQVPDPDAATRLSGQPTFSGTKTTQLIGDMIDGCFYLIGSVATISDGRVLEDNANLMCTTVVFPPDPCAPLSPQQFRYMFPAFANETTYPDAMINMWMGMAPLNCSVWGDMYQMGLGLWVAHEMTKFGPGGMASLPGQTGLNSIPGSKSVNGVSVSYDTNMGSDPEAGQYNMTLYGRQFWSLLKFLPIGPFQFGTPWQASYGWYPYPVTLWGGRWPVTTIRMLP